MAITVKGAGISDTETRSARIWDGSAKGLTIAHLRAFLEQADRVALPEETPVRIADKLASGSSWHTVEVSAAQETRTQRELDDERPKFAPGECEGHACCTAKAHVHGCFADVDGSACDEPGAHLEAD